MEYQGAWIVVQTQAVAKVVFERVRFDSAFVRVLIEEWNDELGFTPKGGSMVEASDFEPPHGLFLVGISDDQQPVACGGLRSLTPAIGEIKRLFVRPAARRCGVAQALLAEMERRAAQMGFAKVRLDTDARATAALALFRSTGYEAIEDYNGNPYASYWFEKQVRGPAG